ncbi:dihydrofolate reductase family protein [Actinomadura barringtoniae]|uniref:Dihydrofolate reductase family protein n=1 Tax=Actinomadura barringtoniae TaxID=1427535 RepID=A0A939PV02_9ACTN|nr:dihydrofolate reductase family protein [Actinomadura barringtoniae]MBO2455509.1 dihydrofolate reductase family protein [Actinomadura barringtoniae]
MRKVVSVLFTTVDGVVESPDQWQFAWDDEMAALLAGSLERCDAVLLGRGTYEMWSGYWPNYTGGEDAAFADWINNSPKYVVSSTLDNVDDWQNSTLTTLADIKHLKEGEGKDISVSGSPGLVASLLAEGLLDELTLLINPVVAGGGRKKLFSDDAALKKLGLVSAQPTSTGAIIATYAPSE